MQCNFCHREGLAILPMRAALIPHNSQFTFLPQNIEMPVDAQGETNYTATLLKEGYLYIFNEKNQEWISYYCTPNGYYSLLPPNSTEFKSSLLAKNEPCSDKPLEQARSRLITLPMDNYCNRYGVFWLAWSPISWTTDMMVRNSSPIIYQTFMQKFDMDEWINSNQTFNTLPITQSQSYLNDSLIKPPQKVPLHIKNWHFFKIQQITDLINSAEQLSPKRAAMIVLQDPTSMAIDLCTLSEERIQSFRTGTIKRQRKLNVTGFVDSLKSYLRMESEKDVFQRLTRTASYNSSITDIDTNRDPDFEALSNKYGADIYGKDEETKLRYFEEYNALMISKLIDQKFAFVDRFMQIKGKTNQDFFNEAESNYQSKWKDYSQYYNQSAADSFKLSFQAEFDIFEIKMIQPLKNMHTAWLASSSICHFFKHNFDASAENYTLHSGAIYTELIMACCAGMQDKIPPNGKLVDDYIYKEMVKDPRDPNNYIARAGYLNNEEWIKKIGELIDSADPWTSIPWQGFFDAYKLVVDQLRLNESNIIITLARYTTVFAGHFTKFIEDFAHGVGKKLNGLLMFINTIEGKSLIIIDETMTRTQAITKTAMIIHENNPVSPKERRQLLLFDSISDELAKLKLFGLTNDENVKVRYVGRIDLKALSAFRKAYGTMSLVTYGKKMAHFIDSGLPSWQRIIDKLSVNFKNFSWDHSNAKEISHTNVKAGIFSILIQSYILIATIKADNRHLMKLGDPGIRFAGNLMIAASTAIGTMESYVNNMSKINPEYKPPLRIFKTGGKFFNLGAKIGAVGAFVVAVLDFIKGYKLWEDGYKSESKALFVSGLGGALIGAAVFGFFVGPLIFVGIILLIGSAVYLFFYQQDAMQKWLERSILGVIQNDSVTMFPTMEMEIDALNELVG